MRIRHGLIMFGLIWGPMGQAQDIPGIAVFGDSLSDTGQFGGLTFTNTNPDGTPGRVWINGVADRYRLPLAPSTPVTIPPSPPVPPANNYAVGGNRAPAVLDSIVRRSVVDASTVINVPPGVFRSERDGYLVDPTVQFDPHRLHVVWGGGNDVRDGTDPAAAADTILASVVALHEAGAKIILVNNLPDIGAVPESGLLGNRATRSADTLTVNSRLALGLPATGANVVQTDIYTLMREVIADPTRYGFADVDVTSNCFDGAALTDVPCLVEDPVYGVNGTSPDASKLVFFDGIHPTQTAHALLGEYVVSMLEAPGLISTLAETPLSSGRAHLRQLHGQLESEAIGKRNPGWRGFVTAEGFDNDWDDADYDDDGYQVSAGAAYRFDPVWLAGAALGFGRSDVDFDRHRGGFDQNALYLSLFGRYQIESVTADAVLAYGDLDFDDIDRKNLICAGCRRERGRTDGDQFLAALALRFDLLAHETRDFGPYFGLTYQDVSVDGYRERGAARATSLRFGGQDQDSLMLLAGLQGRHAFRMGGRASVIRGRLLREKEALHDPRTVEAGLRTVPGSGYRLAAIDVDQDAWSVGLGLSTELAEGVRAGLDLNWREGDGDFREQAIQLGIQVDL